MKRKRDQEDGKKSQRCSTCHEKVLSDDDECDECIVIQCKSVICGQCKEDDEGFTCFHCGEDFDKMCTSCLDELRIYCPACDRYVCCKDDDCSLF